MAAKGFSTSNYISNTAGVPATGPLTLFCWVNPACYPVSSAPNNDRMALMFAADPADDLDWFELSLRGDHLVRASCKHNATTGTTAVGTTALSVNTWYAVAASDNAAGNNRIAWLNGVAETTVTASAVAPDTMSRIRLGVESPSAVLANPLLTGAGPLFRAAGAGAAAVGDGSGGFAISPAFPATTVTEDIAFLQVFAEALAGVRSVTVDTPSGWTLLFQDDLASTACAQYIFWKQCAGTEGSATVSVTGTYGGTTANTGIYGRIYVYSDVALSSFSESGGTTNGTDTTAEISSITSSVDNCLGMFFCGVANDVTQAAISGNTATWTEPVAEFTSVTGVDASIGLQNAVLTTAGTFSGGSSTLGASPGTWITRAFSLKPRNSGVQGKLAHCAVWNVELSASDHLELAAGVSPLLVRPSALTFYAPLLDNATLNELVPVNTLTGSLTFESDG